MGFLCSMLGLDRVYSGMDEQVFLDGEAALEEEERKEERAGKEFRRFNHRCCCLSQLHFHLGSFAALCPTVQASQRPFKVPISCATVL